MYSSRAGVFHAGAKSSTSVMDAAVTRKLLKMSHSLAARADDDERAAAAAVAERAGGN